MKELEKLLEERKEISFARESLQDDLYKQNKNEVIKILTDNLNQLAPHIILEIITHLGGAPNLVYDDNGNWAVSGIGYQEVVTGDEKIEGSNIGVFIESRDQWFPTIKEAVDYYFNESFLK